MDTTFEVQSLEISNEAEQTIDELIVNQPVDSSLNQHNDQNADDGENSPSVENLVSLRSRKVVSTAASAIPRPSTTIVVLTEKNHTQERRQRPASVGPNAASRLPCALNSSSGKNRPTSSTFERSRSDVISRQQSRTPRSSTSHHRRVYTMPESRTSLRHSASSPSSDLSSNSSNPAILRSFSAVESNGNGSVHTCAKIVSKIGSLDNVTHRPGGGNVKIFHESQKFEVGSKCGSKDNIKHKPGGGHVQIIDEKIKLEVQAKIASLEKVSHKPGGGDVKIVSQKLSWECKSRIGSLENAQHKPGGGDIKIHEEKLQWNTTSKVGSLENCKHKPGGGNIQIFSEVPAWIKAGGRPNLPHEERDEKYRYSKKSGGSVSSSNSNGYRPEWQE